MKTWILGAIVATLSFNAELAAADPAPGSSVVAQSTIEQSGRRPGDPVINVPGAILGTKYVSLTGGKPVTPQALFGRALRPVGMDSHQGRYDDKSGHAGNCYLMATTAAYAEYHPETLKRVFLTEKGDLRTSTSGSAAARFFEKDRETKGFKAADPVLYDGRAPVRADGQMAFGKLTSRERIWSQMFEYSYTKFRNQQGGAARSSEAGLDRAGFNQTANGGYPNHVMQAITGKPTETINVEPHHEDEIWGKLQQAQAKNQVVVVGSMLGRSMKERVRGEIGDGHLDGRYKGMKIDEKTWVDGHAYAAWGDKDHPFVFEQNGERMIRLRNAWGLNPPGGKGQDGVGVIPFKQFMLRYDRVWVGAAE
jgi:hypothetical protein